MALTILTLVRLLYTVNLSLSNNAAATIMAACVIKSLFEMLLLRTRAEGHARDFGQVISWVS